MAPEPTAPDLLISSLKTASRAAAPILLLRHSVREPISEASMEAALEAPLTDTGRELARALGPRLSCGRLVRVYHSPVPRCEETARLLAQGLEAAGEKISWVGADELIAAPFLQEPQQAVERFAELGMAGFVKAWVQGELPPRIIAPFAAASANLLSGLLARRTAAPEALQLHVTHDLTMVTLLGAAFLVDDPGFHWPDYLEGCVLQLAPWPELHYGGHALPLTLPG